MAVGERDAAIGTRIARIAGLLDRPETLLRPEPAGRAALAVGRLAAAAVRGLLRERNPQPAPLFDHLPPGPARGFHRLVVRSVVRDTADSAIVEFDIPALLRDRYTYAAGQHLVIRGTRRGEPIRRSYSLCDAPGAGRVRITVKRQPGGAFSSYVLDERITGSALFVSEPSGLFTPELDSGARNEYAAVAAGSGITPIVSIIATVLGAEPNSAFTLYYGNRDRANIMLAQSVRELCDRYPGRFRVVHHLSRHRPRTAQDSRAQYRYGRMTAADIVRRHADRWYLCGPKALVTETVDALHASGVPGSRIRVELFETRVPDRPRSSTGTATSRITLTGYGEPLEFGMPRDRTILDAALDEREDLPYSCLGGSCGTCLAVVVAGHAEMDPDPLLAISGAEIAGGQVLACRTRPVSEQVTLRFGAGPRKATNTGIGR